MRRTTPLNLPAPGRRQCVYVVLRDFARTCVFAKQSLGPIRCDPPKLRCTLHLGWHPFFRSYGISMPSSLTRFHSFTLGYSPCPPVSVCGTDICSIPHWSFSCQSTLHDSRLGCPAQLHSGLGFPTPLDGQSTRPLTLRSWVPPGLLTRYRRGRNFNRLSIVYASGAST